MPARHARQGQKASGPATPEIFIPVTNPIESTFATVRPQVDAANSYGNTPLATAVFDSRGRGELIQLLRRHGADPRYPNNTGQTPVGIARLIANYDVAQFFADLTDPDPKT